MAGLTTHVLDTALGRPAEGLTIDLYNVEGEMRYHLKTVVTNADGRVEGGAMLTAGELQHGVYELVFRAGDYLRRVSDAALPDLLFLNEIPIRFGIDDPQAHYHVPLLLSPFGYSTYRGS